ncbi:MAG: Bifunctional folate synthesis protein [candidate division WS2 bacterium]|uniref:7,8-dihydroneopterin aldolase n=1 Tax=Psychracetigena formicireducens TaxID=2986056 RepID=A0A9E2BH09_PSYF1|nr:Bifunctional folate synthesis protein [Candidatus Psychracetigena formicireducens]MBT9144426.1 Bifunctional folate synthesis protein [Candidatus Psychracetigena formicireducens]
MDRIIIKDMEVYGYHGVYPEEKKLGQMFLVSVEMKVDLSAAGHVDNLECSIDYGQICDHIKQALTENCYDLIEAAAIAVIEKLFEKHPAVYAVRALIKKPWAPLGHHLKYVAVELERSRAV